MNLELLNAAEFAAIDRDNTPVFLPLGSAEQHGPHLPLGTKGMLAEGIAFEAVQILKKQNLPVLVAPTFPYVPCRVSHGFPGCFGILPRTFSEFLFELCQSFQQEGFRHIFLINPFFSLEVLKAIDTVIGDFAKVENFYIYDPLPLWRFSPRPELSEALKSFAVDPDHDLHAGALETGAVRYLDEGMVTAEYAQLPSVTTNLAWETLKGNFSLQGMGAANGYLGDPACGSIEVGHIFITHAGNAVAQTVSFVLSGNEPPPLPLALRMVLKLVDLDD